MQWKSEFCDWNELYGFFNFLCAAISSGSSICMLNQVRDLDKLLPESSILVYLILYILC